MIPEDHTMPGDNGIADLHMHTTRSDGYCSPAELIRKAADLGLRAIAITDHDEISAVSEARKYGEDAGVEVVAGVELSVNYRQHDLHVLGYCFDFENQRLLDYLKLFKDERVRRAEKMVKKLAAMGMPISFDAVLARAGDGTIGRPHIANLLLEEKFVYSFEEAFYKYIGNGKPAYVEKYRLAVQEAFSLVRQAGGVCAIAHPGIQLSNGDLISLIKSGVDAVEVVHPKHSEEQTRFYRELTGQYGLLATGGSDFHGGVKGNDTLGKYTVPYDVVTHLKALSNVCG
jgi:predicted metal-dependent phosphoesterase TrpH